MFSAVRIVVLIAVLSVPGVYAQPSEQASNLQTVFFSGQTFLTWDEIPEMDISYNNSSCAV